jgi:hypothetical protein
MSRTNEAPREAPEAASTGAAFLLFFGCKHQRATLPAEPFAGAGRHAKGNCESDQSLASCEVVRLLEENSKTGEGAAPYAGDGDEQRALAAEAQGRAAPRAGVPERIDNPSAFEKGMWVLAARAVHGGAVKGGDGVCSEPVNPGCYTREDHNLKDFMNSAQAPAQEQRHFYLQDSRGNVGDNLMFWAKSGGYTSDTLSAEQFTEESAFSQNHCRSSDVPWPADYIAGRTRPVVDMQYVKASEAEAFIDSESFYRQDPSRHYIGNDLLFLSKDGVKHTTNLLEAKVFPRSEVFGTGGRNLDGIFWPKNYIDQKSRVAAHYRQVKLKDALKTCTSVLAKPERVGKPRYRCESCGVFMSEKNYYTIDCIRCGCNNRP